MAPADILRAVTLIASGGVFFMTLLVVVVYMRRYCRDIRLARHQGQQLAWRGLLPLHVSFIGVSYTGLQVVAVSVVLRNLHTYLRWQTIVVCVSMLLGVAGQWMMARWQRRIYPRHDESPPSPAPLIVDPPAPGESKSEWQSRTGGYSPD